MISNLNVVIPSAIDVCPYTHVGNPIPQTVDTL
jgi:hypothetical protein